MPGGHPLTLVRGDSGTRDGQDQHAFQRAAEWHPGLQTTVAYRSPVVRHERERGAVGKQ